MESIEKEYDDMIGLQRADELLWRGGHRHTLVFCLPSGLVRLCLGTWDVHATLIRAGTGWKFCRRCVRLRGKQANEYLIVEETEA